MREQPQECVDAAMQRQAEAFWHCAETAQAVRRRHQFFIWTQASLQRLLPHPLMLCSAWSPVRRQLQAELFNSLPLPDALLQWLQGASTQAWLQQRWLQRGGGALTWTLGDEGLAEGAGAPALPGPPGDARAPQMLAQLDAAGLRHVSVAGVSRPQRAEELETFFVLCSREPLPAPVLGLLTPLLHAAWRRVMAQELQLAQGQTTQASTSAQGVTVRERQVLAWMRQGKSNQEIGLLLGISALTVKNHVQKILRKLSASNRAQAVAQAMSLQLLNEGGVR